MQIKKFLPIIVGVCSGLVIGGTMIALMPEKIAYSADEDKSFWNDLVARGENFSWREVFATNDGDDIYMMIYKKSIEYPQKTALREIAGNFGLTTDEAQAVIDGSATPIFNNSDRKSTELTQQEALGMVRDLQEDYEMLKEIYEVQQEVDMAIKPSEIFANGDLSDSGFDLIHDLDIIEKIIFLEQTPISVGGLFSEEVDSPITPTAPEQKDNSFVASDTPAAVDRLGLKADEEGNLTVGDDGTPVEVLESDICEVESPLIQALKILKDSQPEDGEGAAGGGVEDIVGNGEGDEDDTPEDPTQGIEPAPADPWGSAWCPGLGEDGNSSVDNFSEDNFKGFVDNFKSIGGSSPAPMFTGFGESVDNEYIQANAAMCITMTLVRETISSYQPGDSCLICEVEKINELMDETLSHTLIPNKVTGNLLESAKCKETNGSLLNFQVITIWNPIPAPANDELIFGKNIFEEWNNFAQRYQPALLDNISFEPDDAPDTSISAITEYESGNIPDGLSQAELYYRVLATKDAYVAEALQEVKEYEKGNTGSNQLLYLRTILGEMENMNGLFTSYRDLFGKIDKEAIQKIKAKPNIQ